MDASAGFSITLTDIYEGPDIGDVGRKYGNFLQSAVSRTILEVSRRMRLWNRRQLGQRLRILVF